MAEALNLKNGYGSETRSGNGRGFKSLRARHFRRHTHLQTKQPTISNFNSGFGILNIVGPNAKRCLTRSIVRRLRDVTCGLPCQTPTGWHPRTEPSPLPPSFDHQFATSEGLQYTPVP